MASVSTWERIERRKLHQRERWKRPARPGNRPDPSRPACTDTLPQIKHIVILMIGNVLLLHTDGLTERNPHLRDEAELQALLTSVDGHNVHQILEQIERQSLGPGPRRLADDVAILLLRAQSR